MGVNPVNATRAETNNFNFIDYLQWIWRLGRQKAIATLYHRGCVMLQRHEIGCFVILLFGTLPRPSLSAFFGSLGDGGQTVGLNWDWLWVY